MIIAVYSRIKIDQILHHALLGASIAAGIALVSGIVIMCFSPWQSKKEMLACQQALSETISKKVLSYVAIGEGPLKLKCAAFCPLVMKLKEEVMILAQNTRPDVNQNQVELLVQLKTANEKQITLSGALLYLKEENDQLHFSSSPTDFWIRPLFVEDGGLRLEAEKMGEKTHWVAHASEELGKKIREKLLEKEVLSFTDVLKNAKFWGLDALVQHYAGKEHQELIGKYKLIVGDHAFFVSEGDLLVWQDGAWLLTKQGIPLEPLAQVRAVSSKGIELDVWDGSGFQMLQVKLNSNTSSKLLHSQNDQMPTAIRLRTSSQVACTLGKRRLILKEGDWLIKTKTGWRKLKSSNEIDDCLFHKIKGDLFIFDRLEKLPGKTLLHAHLFDEMRTQVQTLTIPVAAEKKKISGGKT